MSAVHSPSNSDDKQRLLVSAIEGVASGDADALRVVYGMTSAKLFGICLRICGERASAEDVLQAVYIRVWERAGRFDAARASPITWLATIARNSAIDWRRSVAGRAVRDALPLEAALAVADDEPRADQMLMATEDGEKLRLCMEELDERTRWCIRSAFFDGSTYAELAHRENIPLGTMKSWIRRGLMRLKGCLGNG
ncbi:RNA polymerase sigma-70 factor (ECF subfamily) [Sphingopyxis italica]|uniref:RNA polymerase sigma factor n=1 Tax=Sphingopyxis italica TaxID=1129133 RepID=A0A7X5XQC0_9SPHN|nr:RNA polymerase sigma-70 factor (ECF subfamily) [Sphingopyxis italica]